MPESAQTSSNSTINDHTQTEVSLESWETPTIESLQINIDTELGPGGSGPVT